MSIIDGYLDQLQIMNQLTSGNLQQFLPSKDTSFLRGGGLPTGNGIPKSRGGLESKMYHRRQPNVRRQIENIGEEKEVSGSDDTAQEDKEDKDDNLPEDTNKSVVKLSGSTGGRSHVKTSLRDSSESPTPKEEQKMSSSSNVAEQKEIEESIRGDPEKEDKSKESVSSVLPKFNPNLPTRVKDIVEQTKLTGESFIKGSTKSPFFVPNDETLPIQFALTRGEWKQLSSKTIRSDKIGAPIPFTKDGVGGHLFFMTKNFARDYQKIR